MRYKRRFVRVYRDFPQGCGVFSRYRSNADYSLMQSKFKSRVDFPGINEASRIEGLDDLKDVSTEDESVLESGGSGKDHQEEEGIGESEDKQNEMSSVKKRCLSFHNSTTMEVETNVVDTSKRAIVSGLAAKSKCPWRDPPKNRGSRQEKRRGMRYKRRFVRVYRDFPQGCGVFSRYRSNADDSLMQSKFKSRVDFPGINEASRIEGLDDLKDVSTEDESVLESGGSGKDHQEEEGIGESEDKQNEMSSVKKRCLSFHNSTTMEVETNVVDTSKRAIVSGLAAKSKCPWRDPPKNRGSRQEKRRWIL